MAATACDFAALAPAKRPAVSYASEVQSYLLRLYEWELGAATVGRAASKLAISATLQSGYGASDSSFQFSVFNVFNVF